MRPPLLGYRYEFHPGELRAIRACNEAHGFVVVKGVLSPWYVEELKASVREVLDPEGDLGRGETRGCLDFIERSRPAWRLLEDQRFLEVMRAIAGDRDMTLHRTAAIMKNPGAPAAEWHSDWCGYHHGPPRHAGDILNQGDLPSGSWFYLTGTHPKRGGLAVIEDSHTLDWPGPPGFVFSEDRHWFHPASEEPRPYGGKDLPGAVPLFTDPGDLIVFAARTYHSIFGHEGDEPRLSMALGFRAGRSPWPTPWKLTASARRFLEEAPAGARPLLEHYTGLDPRWRPG